jgi:hypothetical protein
VTTDRRKSAPNAELVALARRKVEEILGEGDDREVALRAAAKLVGERMAERIVAEALGEAPPRRSLIRRPQGPAPEGTLAALVRKQFAEKREALAGILPAEGAGIIGGPKSVGKTALALAFALDFARGAESHLGRKLDSGVVVYFAMEHSEHEFQALVLHHLKLMGESLSAPWLARFHVIARDSAHDPPPEEQAHRFPWVASVLSEKRPRLAVLDTLTELRPPREGNDLFIDDKRVGERLRAMGIETACLIVALFHTKKGAKGRDPAAELVATTGLPAGVGFVHGLMRSHGASRGVLVCSGNFIAPQRIPLAWSDVTRTYSLGDAKEGRSADAMQAAQAFLLQQLAHGPRRASELLARAAEEELCSDKTLKKAKAALGIESKKQRGEWIWLPPKTH